MVEQFAAGNDLISLRSRESSFRPLTVVRELEADAQKAYFGKIQALEDELQKTNAKLQELQKAQGAAGKSGQLLTPEQQAEMERFRKTVAEARLALKEVRKNLRQDAEGLVFWTKVANIALMPLLLALIGLLVATYLSLYKLGIIGTLACGTGSCETVQLSRWATFLGLPVAAWGVGYYLLVLALTLASVQDRWADSRTLSLTILGVTGCGLLFTAWLTYLELFVIHAICRWCVGSAVLATVLFVLALWDYRSQKQVQDSGVSRN